MSFRVSHAGVISFADGSLPLECTVYEVSAAGAQLKVPTAQCCRNASNCRIGPAHGLVQRPWFGAGPEPSA